jgi:hypothetical protein
MPWSLASGHLCQVSRSRAERGAGYVGADVLVGGVELAEQGERLAAHGLLGKG